MSQQVNALQRDDGLRVAWPFGANVAGATAVAKRR
ncbi:hypothetical protein M2307_000814 [Bradyrhizobium japonicum]|jgi:hypothetical protein|nr:hypothetical protein [Bradyrhizobium japonicum]MCS4013647.1 hypothetical protein [Bradyrhizobium japonicum]MDH6171875.1 hypothetical protein [Bradyrhizobium japonicum]